MKKKKNKNLKRRKLKRKNRRKKQAVRNKPRKGRNLQGCLLNQLIGR